MDTKEENTLENQALLNKKKPLIRCPICGSRMWRNNFLRHAKQRSIRMLYMSCMKDLK